MRKGGRDGESAEACTPGTQLQRSSCVQPAATARTCGLPRTWTPGSGGSPPGPAPGDRGDLSRGVRLRPSPRGAAERAWAPGAGRGAGTRRGRRRGGGAGREGGARAPIGQRGVPWPFMAAGPGHRSKTKGRRPAGRRREDASRRAGAPTARPRPGPRRDRLKAEPAPPEPGPDGRCGPGRGPPSGREYGRAPGGCSAATRTGGSGRAAGKHLLGAGGRAGGAGARRTSRLCSVFPACWCLVHDVSKDNTKPQCFDFFFYSPPPFSLLFSPYLKKKWERK